MTKGSDNPFPSILVDETAAASVGTPAAGFQRVFIDTADNKLKRKNSGGTSTTIEGLANPMTTQGDVIYGGASGVPTRLAVGTAAQVLKVNAGATAPEWGAGGGSPVYDIERYTAGDITLGSGTSPVAVPGPADVVVAAASGDLLMVGLSCRSTDTDADSLAFDFATIVSAAAVNFLSSLSITPATTGVPGWWLGVSRIEAVHGEHPYVVQAGDISGGNVTLRLYYRVSAVGKVLGASTGVPLEFWVRNLGQ